MIRYVTSIFYLSALLLSCSMQRQQTEENTIRSNSDSTLQTGWYYIIKENKGFTRKLDKDTVVYSLDPSPIITAKNIVAYEIYEGSGYVGLSMQLDQEGTKAWEGATEKSVGRHIAFIVDDQLMSAPLVNAAMPGGMTALNRSVYSKEELMAIQERVKN